VGNWNDVAQLVHLSLTSGDEYRPIATPWYIFTYAESGNFSRVIEIVENE
jgi:hypothetical protein